MGFPDDRPAMLGSFMPRDVRLITIGMIMMTIKSFLDSFLSMGSFRNSADNAHAGAPRARLSTYSLYSKSGFLAIQYEAGVPERCFL